MIKINKQEWEKLATIVEDNCIEYVGTDRMKGEIIAHRQIWLDTMRSGKYEKLKKGSRRWDNRDRDANVIACSAIGIIRQILKPDETLTDWEERPGNELEEDWVNLPGFEFTRPVRVTKPTKRVKNVEELNDNTEHTLPEIADIIERELDAKNMNEWLL